MSGERKRMVVNVSDIRFGDEINYRGGDFAMVESVTSLVDGIVEIKFAEPGAEPIRTRGSRQITVYR